MISLVRAILVFALLLILPACAFINSFDSNLDKQVDVWMAKNQYAKVIDTLKYVRPSNPNYQLLQKKRQQAIEEAHQYEQSQISKALNQMASEQWHGAEITLNDAMDNLPDSQPLHKTYQEFIRQRAQFLDNLYCQLDLNKAKTLVNDKPIQEKLEHAIPDDRKNQQALENYREDSQQVTQRLLVCADNAGNIGDLKSTEHYYRLAYALQPNATIKAKLLEVQEKLSPKHPPAPSTKPATPALSELGRSLLEKSKHALNTGNLKQAINDYNRIPAEDKNLQVVKAYERDMNHRIRENINQGIELGRKLYSQGQVEQALAIWNKLLELDPDNENLLSHIERAERVLDKINQLRKEQTPKTEQANPDTAK